ncbi:MAG: hypothetical protein QOI61_2084 [Actinomycetota bacterium]
MRRAATFQRPFPAPQHLPSRVGTLGHDAGDRALYSGSYPLPAIGWLSEQFSDRVREIALLALGLRSQIEVEEEKNDPDYEG